MSSAPRTDAEWASYISQLKERIPGRSLSQPMIPLQIPPMIDHTLLNTQADLEVPADSARVDKLCDEAKEYGFATVCVRREHVSRAVANLQQTPNTGVSCVVGFPEGTYDTNDKVREALEAVAKGATDLDMVINWPLLKNGAYAQVYEDIMAVRRAAPAPTKLKAIVEAAQLDRDQLIAATIVCCTAGVDFVKTCTGYAGSASVDHVTTMRLVAELGLNNCQIKASGGIRTAGDCLRMMKAGAKRIGTTSGIAIMKEIDEGELLEQGAGHAVT
ncbi:Aldolase-type TIM barrel [Penicillium capsulatum]|uniref:deoxyribose-phosphate aldolase n=1 Tax=Penicillium capsulatum TaxID=69766 RepID=A0A9W9I006_9EURO|nr:Aldolase-type TIM barrel [Penicillium capsulatum]KAJ6117375.1 Aldolase-type TIM barrel [Penicillium capsulatum]